ncbi:MAG TPA: maleylpyruvate isomerase family mycothiol-dependent enzyme [Streptosporangiaceae bacterium]|nr:maleylpyruvate isomerase family mycothiol-dependent enzyme [Streptosporangiaceae bacterium]
MPKLPAELYYAEIDASTASLAVLIEYADPVLPIPACPDWTLSQLAAHVGRVQRRSAEMVATRATGPIDPELVPDIELPADLAARGRWLTAGAGRLISALREAGEETVWAFGTAGPAGVWARRMANEAMVHAADAAAAAGEEVSFVPELAADAIDEWLTLLSGPIFGRPDRRAAVLPEGASLHVHATDPELGSTGEWLVTHEPGGVEVVSGHAKATVAVSGAAADLLLVLLGRRSPASGGIQVFGDAGLLDAWLAGISF